MLGFNKPREEHSGIDCYRYADPLLRDAHELYIISPFLDDYYAKFIKSYSHAKKIYIISSSPTPEALKTLGTRTNLTPIFLIILIAAANLLMLFYNFFNTYLILGSAVAALIMLAWFYFEKSKEPIQLKKPQHLYHMKIYVSDKMAIKGSANLTYAGMHRNHESISVFRDMEGVSSAKKEFFQNWNSA